MGITITIKIKIKIKNQTAPASGVIQCGAGKSVVPEGQRKLAGGVSHRNRPPGAPAPEGRWSGRGGEIPTPLPGRIHFSRDPVADATG